MKRKNLSKSDRKIAREGKTLSSLALRPQTHERYMNGVLWILPTLEKDPQNIPEVVADFVEQAYEDGESLGHVSDMLCGIHHHMPWLKGQLNNAWRLFRIWKRNETVDQATPFPPQVVHAMIFRSLELGNLAMSALLAAGFYGLLRTGEILKLNRSDVACDKTSLVLNLGYTKAGFRQGVEETVVIRHPRCLLIWKTFLDVIGPHSSMLWPFSGSYFRAEFDALLQFFGLSNYGFRPYSLRRRGATAMFRADGLLEKVLIMGRWKTHTAATNYIHQGMATLAKMRFNKSSADLIYDYAKKFSAR